LKTCGFFQSLARFRKISALAALARFSKDTWAPSRLPARACCAAVR